MVKRKEATMKTDDPERPGAVARITITVRRLGNRYVAELKADPHGVALAKGRANNRASAAKRDMEDLFARKLSWRKPEEFGLRDPDILQAAQLELD